MSWLTDFIPPRIRNLISKREVPEHLWSKCSSCETMILTSDFEKSLYVCSHCGHHGLCPPKLRYSHLFDEGSYSVLESVRLKEDPLQFRDQKRYVDRLKDARLKTQQWEAVLLAQGSILGRTAIVACFNFSFVGGSMGLGVGEILIQGAQWALHHKKPYIIFSSSGGARMQEGILSLMQMPRTVLALTQLRESAIPFISVLTHPTTGGVAASFASLGDITLAEPKAVIGFTGARVIQETTRQPLPPGFQTAEFQKDHGFIDHIINRKEMRAVLGKILSLFDLPKCIPDSNSGLEI
ncbi:MULTISPECIES: acetyl-CoA carboxylase carboxyltransferase subunit beta [Holospora]|uniref:Acetyl-coenzyme A carboxylase carboxyl transferase subunit beta n=2 Tax=Holospora TaxID=44747 RepID=A0A061JHX9_9PROT|nr:MULTISPECIES: acetyl-CoA carboxylase carboxyltransferase subunit beta [Holospora]ETZ05112.1 acetyl-coenzyme A carboxylase carboxyl transferase subunit beta [Holospora undulata HU1]GAJ45829.1 acetyl-coenzyme A carboxylase carboxyl transferase subunit beta [Holospora elegans E1]